MKIKTYKIIQKNIKIMNKITQVHTKIKRIKFHC